MSISKTDQNIQSYSSKIPPRQKKPVVMIVDDDPIIRSVLYHMIIQQQPDIDVIECIDGEDAYKKMNKEIQLIFTDNNMPILSGLEFIRKIKSESNYLNIPVIMISVECREEYKSLGKDLGAAGWLVKPFVMSQIQEYLEKYLL